MTAIRRRLHSMEYRYKIVANKIILIHNQMIRKVDIVKKWIWNKIDMNQVVYTDEWKFTLYGNDSSTTWAKNITNSYGSVMVFDRVSRSGLVMLRKLERTLSTAEYCRFLKDDVLPVLKAKYKRFFPIRQCQTSY